MKKIAGILKPIFTGVLYLGVVATMISNAVIAYLVLAPDTMPKPFYFAYADPPAIPEGLIINEEGEVVAEVEHVEEFSIDNMEPGQGIMLDAGVRTYNMAEPGGRRYIKIGVVIEFAPTDEEFYTLYNEANAPHDEEEAGGGDDEHGGEEEVAAIDPLEGFITAFEIKINGKLVSINDTLLSIVSSKSFADIETAEGKNQLRQEVVDVLNESLNGYHVLQVYFTEFVVQ